MFRTATKFACLTMAMAPAVAMAVDSSAFLKRVTQSMGDPRTIQ